MARGTTLEELLAMTRAEAGHSRKVSSGVDFEDSIKTGLRRVQEIFYYDYDWPFLQYQPFKNLVAGERYYDMPNNMDFERSEYVVVWYGGEPYELERGIGPAEYAQYNSNNDERAGPPLRWDIKYVDSLGSEQIEVWPIPPDNTYQLQFYGFRQLNALVADSDRADLDDQLLALTLAGEMLAKQKSANADDVKAMAKARYDQLKARVKSGGSPVTMGGVGTSARERSLRGQTIIRVSRNNG